MNYSNLENGTYLARMAYENAYYADDDEIDEDEEEI